MTLYFIILFLLFPFTQACHISCQCASDRIQCVSCIDLNSSLDQKQLSCPCNIGYYRNTLYPFSCIKAPLNEQIDDSEAIKLACSVDLGQKLSKAIIKSEASTQVVNDETYFKFSTKVDLSQVSVDNHCLSYLTKKLFYQINGVFVSIDSTEIQYNENGDPTAFIPLIKLFDYSQTSAFSDNTITQQIPFKLVLEINYSKQIDKLYDVTIYTNRAESGIFTTNVDTFESSGCQVNEDCIVIADLDVDGYLCENEICSGRRSSNNYIIGDYLYAKIFFTDPSYTKYLQFISALTKDFQGIVSNVSSYISSSPNNQVIVIKLPLIQSAIGLVIQINLKIVNAQLRNLQSENSQNNDPVNIQLKYEVLSKSIITSTSTSTSFSSVNLSYCNLFATFLLLLIL